MEHVEDDRLDRDQERRLIETVFIAGRILFGSFFVMSGINHFMKLEMMSEYARKKGVPAPKLGTLVSGLLLVVGGATLIMGAWTTIGIWLLIAFLIPTTLLMHNFWAVPEEQKINEMTQFMKNMALIGALLMMLIIPEPWPGAFL